jgi:hypothetical protein
VHLQPLRLQADLGQQFFGIVYPSLGAQITFQVMAGALQSAGDEHGIRTPVERPQQINDIHFAGAG